MLEAIQYYDPLGRLKESRFSGSDDGLMRKHLDRHHQAGQTGEQQSEFYHLSHLRKSVLRYEFDRMGNWIKETVQRWSDKNGLVIPTEADLSRERNHVLLIDRSLTFSSPPILSLCRNRSFRGRRDVPRILAHHPRGVARQWLFDLLEPVFYLFL